jgi:hypothetical protein
MDLFDFFVNRVLVAVGTKLLQFHPPGGVPTIFHRGIARNSGGALIWVRSALGAF